MRKAAYFFEKIIKNKVVIYFFFQQNFLQELRNQTEAYGLWNTHVRKSLHDEWCIFGFVTTNFEIFTTFKILSY